MGSTFCWKTCRRWILHNTEGSGGRARPMRIALIAILSFPLVAQSQTAPPRVFLLDAKVLQSERQQAQAHPDPPNGLVKAARAEADKAMTAGPFSVMHKGSTPPSGDKHDYMSQAPYFWPNPDT